MMPLPDRRPERQPGGIHKMSISVTNDRRRHGAMRASSLLAAMLMALAVALPQVAPAADAVPNFSGTWKLNAARGENLGMMSAMQQTLTIAQTATAMTVKEASDFQGQKSSREVKFDLTGATVKNEAAMGGTSDTVARWDAGKLVVTWSSPGSVAGTVNTRTETRSLSADGRTMSVVSVRSGGNAKPVTMVYEKQ
jgi:hypothetical protein